MNASLLREMPCPEGNEGCQKHSYEEHETSNPGYLPDRWHQGVENRKELKLVLCGLGLLEDGCFDTGNIQLFYSTSHLRGKCYLNTAWLIAVRCAQVEGGNFGVTIRPSF